MKGSQHRFWDIKYCCPRYLQKKTVEFLCLCQRTFKSFLMQNGVVTDKEYSATSYKIRNCQKKMHTNVF